MPKVVSPLLSESAVGTLGGLLYRNGTYGPIVSRSSCSPALRTPAQSRHRGALKRAHNDWLTLTPAHQASWAKFARPGKTPRNAYTAAHIRLSPLETAPLPWAPPSATDEYIFAITADFYLPPASDPPLLSIRWQQFGNPMHLINVFGLQTYSNRSTPKPAKLLRWSFAAAADLGVDILLPFPSPVVWARLEMVNWDNGQLVAKHLIKATNHTTLGLMGEVWTQPPSILPARRSELL